MTMMTNDGDAAAIETLPKLAQLFNARLSLDSLGSEVN